MSSLKTVDGRNVVVADASNSILEEREISCNISQAKLGNLLSFIWDLGDTDRKRLRLREALYEDGMGIDSAEATSSWAQFLPYSAWENFDVLINGVSVFETTTPDTDQSKMHVQRLLRRCKTYQEFINTLAGDMTDWTTDGFKPHSDANALFCATISLANNHVRRSVNLTEFLHGILSGLTFHRIHRIEFRIKLRNFSAVADMQKYFKVTALLTDIGRENLLVTFENPRLRLRFERFRNDKPDPIPMSLPLILHHPRYEQKIAIKPFASSTTWSVNLKTAFSKVKMIHAFYFDLIYYNGALQSVLNEGLKYFAKVSVRQNGFEKEVYYGASDLYRYLNKNMINEYGHPIYLKNTCESADGTIDTMRIFVPYIHFKNIHDKISSNVVDNVVVLSGKDNNANDDEIVITTIQTLANHDLVYGVESTISSELFPNGSVQVRGKF